MTPDTKELSPFCPENFYPTELELWNVQEHIKEIDMVVDVFRELPSWTTVSLAPEDDEKYEILLQEAEHSGRWKVMYFQVNRDPMPQYTPLITAFTETLTHARMVERFLKGFYNGTIERVEDLNSGKLSFHIKDEA